MTMAAGVSSRSSSSPQRDEQGASATEYGLLITGIAALIAMTVYVFGWGVFGLVATACDAVMNQVGGAC